MGEQKQYRYLIRVPGRGYFVSRIRGRFTFTYDLREAWSAPYDNNGWKTATEVCEELGNTEAYVCERPVNYGCGA